MLFSGCLVDFVPAALLQDALLGTEPLFAVVPDIRGAGSPPDIAREVRSALGIEA